VKVAILEIKNTNSEQTKSCT
jgi:hypothetical protein